MAYRESAHIEGALERCRGGGHQFCNGMQINKAAFYGLGRGAGLWIREVVHGVVHAGIPLLSFSLFYFDFLFFISLHFPPLNRRGHLSYLEAEDRQKHGYTSCRNSNCHTN